MENENLETILQAIRYAEFDEEFSILKTKEGFTVKFHEFRLWKAGYFKWFVDAYEKAVEMLEEEK